MGEYADMAIDNSLYEWELDNFSGSYINPTDTVRNVEPNYRKCTDAEIEYLQIGVEFMLRRKKDNLNVVLEVHRTTEKAILCRLTESNTYAIVGKLFWLAKGNIRKSDEPNEINIYHIP